MEVMTELQTESSMQSFADYYECVQAEDLASDKKNVLRILHRILKGEVLDRPDRKHFKLLKEKWYNRRERFGFPVYPGEFTKSMQDALDGDVSSLLEFLILPSRRRPAERAFEKGSERFGIKYQRQNSIVLDGGEIFDDLESADDQSKSDVDFVGPDSPALRAAFPYANKWPNPILYISHNYGTTGRKGRDKDGGSHQKHNLLKDQRQFILNAIQVCENPDPLYSGIVFVAVIDGPYGEKCLPKLAAAIPERLHDRIFVMSSDDLWAMLSGATD